MNISKILIYRIGGLEFGLSGESDWEFAPLRRFPDFSSRGTPPAASYQVRIKPEPHRPTGALIFDSGQSWRLFAEGDRRILWVGTRDFNPFMVGNFTPDYLGGEIFVTKSKIEAGKYIFPLSHPLGELLMTNLLSTGSGIMLHSCGVSDGGKGMVFAGISTAGKTTTASLWNGTDNACVLNDDHTIVRKIDGHFRVYGTPWHGEGGYALAEDAPLKMIFILKHAPINKAVRLSPARAAAALLVRAFAPLWSAEGMAFTLHFLDELCQAVPCYELGFVPDQSAVEYVRCLSAD